MGVKSLWKLLEPVGRPILLETFEGKAMAIDSSIWMYQFQATMRDKEGRPLMNAHVLGFLRRIAKLLFHGIKPIFNDRRKKKSGAAASHVKLAERLLAAHMRREALNDTEGAQASPRSRGKAPETPAVKGGYSVYLEDLDPAMPQTPARKKLPEPSSSSSKKPGSSSKKPKFHDHDPYQLPDMDLDETVAKVTRQLFPTPASLQKRNCALQYEIVGDLRLKSRQTSYSRLQKMLEIAHTPLDFSKQQIKNLKQRNELTQQLLTTTDSIGSSHLVIPVRIASERNREYVLMKNEGEAGGWILGIRDDGTRQKPIEIDHENDQNKPLGTDSDDDMEKSLSPAAPDPDLLEYQRSQALSAVAKRYTPKKLAPLTTKAIDRKTKRDPFAGLDAGDPVSYSDEEDEMVSLALQQSLDDAKSRQVQSSSLLMVDSTQEVGGGIFGKPGMLLSSPKASSSFMAPPTPSIPAQTHEEADISSPEPAPSLATSVPSPDMEEVLPQIMLSDIPPSELTPSLALAVPNSPVQPTLQLMFYPNSPPNTLPPEYLKRNTPPLLNVESEPRSPPHVPEVPRPTTCLCTRQWGIRPVYFAVKNKNIQDVRREIDDEIKSLNHQKKAAIRDSEDITQQMVSQIMTMLRLFGIPYITAPMEAEAQCAELVTLSLADGVITDDSDRVFKNMFNQSKTVECFLLSDLSRELGLDRDTLIRLAYLLGSDYVDGLPGVGPVMAMELLKEFPGEGGLHKFKDWWIKVQSGKDRPEDNQSKFRKQFKKKFKDLYLPDEWPNSAVRDAYYHPTVDGSEEPFKWGLPDLDALRVFFREELRVKIWYDLTLEIQAASLNKQGNLNDFFEISSGSGTLAPRKRQAYASKRLQQVVADFRKKQNLEPSDSEGESPAKEKAPTKKRKNNQEQHRLPPKTVGTTNRSSPKPGLKSSAPGSAYESSDEFVGGAEEHAGPSVPLRVALRGRKPAE
ncbi:hypothetical protein BD779DRAFT_1496047 [Infundibulicybe gibba]|nr:hypothetical protein BD779DRAFT_1496047 [Infundibulicybe gibba]